VIRNPLKTEFQAKLMKAAVVPAVNSAWEIKEIETPGRPDWEKDSHSWQPTEQPRIPV